MSMHVTWKFIYFLSASTQSFLWLSYESFQLVTRNWKFNEHYFFSQGRKFFSLRWRKSIISHLFVFHSKHKSETMRARKIKLGKMLFFRGWEKEIFTLLLSVSHTHSFQATFYEKDGWRKLGNIFLPNNFFCCNETKETAIMLNEMLREIRKSAWLFESIRDMAIKILVIFSRYWAEWNSTFLFPHSLRHDGGLVEDFSRFLSTFGGHLAILNDGWMRNMTKLSLKDTRNIQKVDFFSYAFTHTHTNWM